MSTSVVLFTRDLRVQDHPALHAAALESEHVVPLFVLDERLAGGPNRTAFLHESLADLDASLRARGGALVVRRGNPAEVVAEVVRATGARAVHMSADHSAFARARERELGEVRVHPGVTIVPPGAVLPAGSDHYAVFTPYHRAWEAAPWRPVLPAPRRLTLPPGVEPSSPAPAPSAAPLPGGETAGRARMGRWLAGPVADYERGHDDLAGEGTSRLSAYLHLGCVSPLELAVRAREAPGGGPFVRQLAWRDFFHQVLAARPDYPRADYRDRGREWRDDAELLAAWRAGMTGHPLVDAGMRQLLAEGWMHNRTRMLVASFLTKDLGLDWRLGAAHFNELLVDGDLACNVGNWQWAAGTGNDTRPNRRLSPLRQGERFDAAGEYVRRHVPELAGVADPHHITEAQRRAAGYPDPLPTLPR